MKIKTLHLIEYKRFLNLTINLGDNPKKIIVLVGPNGCGKSSVIDSLLFRNTAYSKIGNKSDRDYTYHSLKSSASYIHENVQIEFSEGKCEDVMRARWENGYGNTLFTLRSPYRYNNNLKIRESRATSEIKNNSYGASYSVDIDDKMEENYRRLYIKYNKYLNDQDCKPSEAKKKIIGDLNDSIENCLDLKISSIGDIESNQGTLYFSKVDHPTKIEFNFLSSGEKEVVDLLLDLYLRQEEYCNSIFLIDEPELHINTSIQKKLLIEIEKLVNDDCQIWIATHSIGFLRALQDELKEKSQIIQFPNGINWASTSQVLVPFKKSLAKWKEIFEIALDDLTGLLSPKRIIYCEGKCEPGTNHVERGFDAKVYNIIFGEKYDNTIFISSGGNTELDQRSQIALSIINKVFTDVEILVLKDRDFSSGKKNDENDRQIYLKTNPSTHRVIKRWEIENYLFDKEVLKAFCSHNNKSFKEAEYDDFISDIINIDIKGEVGRIKNYCEITNSINAETFKIELSTYINEEMEIYKELEKCIFERL